MKPIKVNAPVELATDEISKAITPEDLGSLISDLANKMAEPGADFHRRRKIAGEMAGGLSEEATRMLGEVVALAYHNAIPREFR